ncbi:PaaI family thioesterase [Paenibacillus terrae]|uniref:Acyl-coenzyme A thioesterase THEM4 n=1 Tax=Paenibacillus terrae TaxID=159743 RepID=A0A0D7X6L3_9BACL|nr:PaaI family thioesterase [Paenibacillus terrae]KJD47016.1 thioesterase [Paenibacillus terrae]
MDILRSLVEGEVNTFWEYLGCELIEADANEVHIALQAGPQHTNVVGIVHGGVLTTLMDQAMGMVSMVSRNMELCVTTNLNVHFLSAMKQGRLEVKARILHQGGRTITTEAEVKDSEGILGCMATATFRVFRKQSGQLGNA